MAPSRASRLRRRAAYARRSARCVGDLKRNSGRCSASPCSSDRTPLPTRPSGLLDELAGEKSTSSPSSALASSSAVQSERRCGLWPCRSSNERLGQECRRHTTPLREIRYAQHLRADFGCRLVYLANVSRGSSCPRNEVGREHEGAGMISIRRIFGLPRLPIRLSAPMRCSFAGGGFSW
jgi:hypothetical protein